MTAGRGIDREVAQDRVLAHHLEGDGADHAVLVAQEEVRREIGVGRAGLGQPDRAQDRAHRVAVAVARRRDRVADRGEELVVEAIEAARRQRHHHVAGAGGAGDVLHQQVDVGQVRGLGPGAVEVERELLRIEPLLLGDLGRIVELAHHHLVGVRERDGELVLERAATRGRRARIVRGDDAALGEATAQALERLAHRGRVVRVVVEHPHAAGDAAQLLAATHAGEARHRAADDLGLHAALVSHRDRRDHVADVVAAAEQRLEAPAGLALTDDLEADAPALAVLEVVRVPGDAGRRFVAVVEHRVGLDAAARARRHRHRVGRLVADHEQAVLGEEHDELAERVAHRVERREDVDVVELDRGQDRGARTVVIELRALVEVRGVVLVALDHEVGALAQQPALTERDRHAADEQARIATRLAQDVRDQRGRRGLAVGAAHHDAVATGQQLLAQHRRERGQRQAALARRGDLDVVARVGVAHHHQVGLPVEVGRGEPLEHRDLQRRELVAHRRVQRGVRATDVVARRTEQACDRTHAGAADSDEVDLHGARNVYARPGSVKRRWSFCRRRRKAISWDVVAGSERRLHHRDGTRPGRRLTVQWCVADGAWQSAETRDIGVGGAFLLAVAAAVGTTLALAVPVPGRLEPLMLDAVVRWASPDGVGVQFLDVDIDVLLELNSLLAEHAGATRG